MSLARAEGVDRIWLRDAIVGDDREPRMVDNVMLHVNGFPRHEGTIEQRIHSKVRLMSRQPRREVVRGAERCRTHHDSVDRRF